MNVLLLQVFVSLMLVVGSVIALLYSVKQGDHEHSDRLSLLPLEDDHVARAATIQRSVSTLKNGSSQRG
jgi:nitrogen fixation-related uncharacterized protein